MVEHKVNNVKHGQGIAHITTLNNSS